MIKFSRSDHVSSRFSLPNPPPPPLPTQEVTSRYLSPFALSDMNFNATDDNLVLVAPRPVRLATSFSPVLATRTNNAAFRMLSATPTEALDRFKFADDNQDTRDGQPEQTAARMSPR